MGIRIAIITDIHHGDRLGTKRGDTALALIDQFATFVAQNGADLVLDLGDRITDSDTDTDIRLEEEVAEALSHLPCPVHHLCGNNDRDHLSVAENERITGQSLSHDILDLGDWALCLWRADTVYRMEAGRHLFSLPRSDLDWIEGQAAGFDKPTLVASHVPVSGHSQIGNYYFECAPASATYPEAGDVRRAIARAKVPVVWISGHVHWNTATQIDGIWHLTQQSLTESFSTNDEPAAAWGLLELGPEVTWEVFGRDPFKATLAPQSRRWRPPLTKP